MSGGGSGLKYATYAGLADSEKRRRASGKKPGEGGDFMGILTYFPLLAIPVVVYNLIAWGGLLLPGTNRLVDRLHESLVKIPMPSAHVTRNAEGVLLREPTYWHLTAGDLLLALSLFLLFVELLKSTSTGRSAIANHALSLLIMLVCLVEFLIFSEFATGVFFLITLMALLDVLAGFIVTIVTARRDIAVGEGFE